MKDNHDDLLNQQLGNYKLSKLLGQGGFADVYLGEHIHLHTQAAIKVLRIRLTNENIDNFRAEAQTIAHLEHPHIVRILEYGIEQDRPFLVMSYAPHGSLRSLHPRGTRLPISTVITYIQQAASALEYGHQQRIIHRDIKPENMLLSKDNEVLLSDFGIALIAQSSHNSAPDITGTAIYMAPEQTQGRVVPASDQYALAVVAYEWITGEPPFKGSVAELIAQHLSAPVPPPQDKVPGIAPDIVGTLYRALAKGPEQRFPSITAFAEALASASESTQRSANPTPIIPPPPPGALTPIIPPPPPQIYPIDPYQSRSIPTPNITPSQPMSSASNYQPTRTAPPSSIPGYTPMPPTPAPTPMSAQPTPPPPSHPANAYAALSQSTPIPPTKLVPDASGFPTLHQPQTPAPPAEPKTVQSAATREHISRPAPETKQAEQATPAMPPKAPRKRRGRVLAIVIALLILILVIAGGTLYASTVLLPKQNASTPTAITQTTPTPTPTPSITPTPTMTPTPTAIPETILYQADWSTNADGWKTGGQWKWISNKSLGSDGTNQGGNYTLIAPYKPTSSDYAVEAVIQYNSSVSSDTNFNLVARSVTGKNGYVGGVNASNNDAYIAHLDDDSTPDETNKQDYTVDNTQHTYRLEVKGNVVTFLIDGQQVSQITDNRYTEAGQVGIRSKYADINVFSFKVVALTA